MAAFSLLFCVAFIAAFALGWWRYRSFFWNYIDLIYYPLVAIGVALLFLSNDVQRELLDVTQLAEQQSVVLADFRTKKPDVNITNTENLLAANLEHIALITKWAEICHGGPLSVEARCLAVKKLGPLVQTFLEATRRDFPRYEDRLLATCTAGDKLLDDIRSSEALSTLVMDKLLAQYERAASLNLSPLDFEAVREQASQFKEQATSYAAQIQRLAFKPDDKAGQLLLDVRRAEIDYGEILLFGLSQCISAPRRELELLKKWGAATSTRQQEVARLEAQQNQLKQQVTKHTTSLWLQLNLWPLVLLAALSLKFAKGAATLRKARRDAT